MDSDFKTSSGDPVKSEPTRETKVPVMDDSSVDAESPTPDVDSSEADSSKSDEPMTPDKEESSSSMDDKPPVGDSFEASETPLNQDEPDSLKPDTTTDSKPLVTEPAVVPPVKIHGAHKFIYGYVGLLVLVAAVVGVYVWQHNKVSGLDAQLAAVNSELSSQQAQVVSLKSQLSKANSAAASSIPAILGLSVVKATRYTPSGTNSTKNSGVAVDVSITNSTTKAVSLVTSNFKLKDAQSNSYVATNFPAQTTDSSLPSGYTLLIDQSIAPNATVQGTLEFAVPTTSPTSFSLVYNSQTEAVTVN